MSEFEIRIPARKKQPATDKDNPVVKVSTVAYNALWFMTRRNSNGNTSINYWKIWFWQEYQS